MLTLKRFESRLQRRAVGLLEAKKRAAVAIVLRFRSDEAEVLLMRRAIAEGDPWSGQVCFPGGKAEAADTSLRATATRETSEELGIDLGATARFLGPMDSISAMARGRVLSTSISPFVFVQTRHAPWMLSTEAAHAFWLPLGPAARGDLDSKYEYRYEKGTMQLGCYRYDDEVIWGLTHKMLVSLLALVE